MSEVSAPLLRVRTGVIRGNRVRFIIAHPPEFTAWDRIQIQFVLLNDRVVATDVAACRPNATPKGLRFEARLPRKKVLHSIRLVPDDPAIASVELPPPAEYGLSNLLPPSLPNEGKEMPEALSRANTVRDVETLGFILAQILGSNRYSDYVKTEVVKKYAYKCMQNGTDDDTRRAIVLIDSMWGMLDVFTDKYGKKNPMHLRVSLFYIRMLCYIVVGDFEHGIADMEELFELRTWVPAVPLICYNLNRATLLFAWALGMAGEKHRASLMFDATINAFREGAWYMPARRPGPFGELDQPLRCAAQAVGCVTALRKSEVWDGHPGALYMAQEYSRLEGAPSHKRLAGRLQELVQYIRAHGATRSWTAGLTDAALQGGTTEVAQATEGAQSDED